MANTSARLRMADWRALDTPAGRAAWDGLAAAAAEPNPFHESWYLLPALGALDPAGTVRLACLEAADGTLLGLLPLRRETRYYRWFLPQWCNWIHGNCFVGAPLVAAGHEAAFWTALLGWADANAGAGLFLHLSQLPLDGALYAALQDVLAQHRRRAGLVLREDRAQLASGQDADSYYAASLSGKKRKELRRQFARLGELGVLSVERRSDDAGLAQWTERFLALEASGWKGAAGSALASHPATATLFTQALAGAAARGKLQRLALLLDGRPVAMLATFLTPPGAFSFKTAFDEDYARFSPGVLLQREALALLDDPAVAWTDSCAAADHPMIDHLWRERRPIGRLSIAIGGTLRRALFAAWLRLELRGKQLQLATY